MTPDVVPLNKALVIRALGNLPLRDGFCPQCQVKLGRRTSLIRLNFDDGTHADAHHGCRWGITNRLAEAGILVVYRGTAP